jgi:hypothetical protein
MRIVAVAAACGLVALTGFSFAPLRSASAQDGPAGAQPGFCATLLAAVREAPTGFRNVRGYGRDVTPHFGIPERDYEHTVSTPLAGAQCIVRTRHPAGANDGRMICAWSSPAPAQARTQAFYDAARACLGGDGRADQAPKRADWTPDGWFALITRGRASIEVVGGPTGLTVAIGRS